MKGENSKLENAVHLKRFPWNPGNRKEADKSPDGGVKKLPGGGGFLQ